jgi:hypothetical protein
MISGAGRIDDRKMRGEGSKGARTALANHAARLEPSAGVRVCKFEQTGATLLVTLP